MMIGRSGGCCRQRRRSRRRSRRRRSRRTRSSSSKRSSSTRSNDNNNGFVLDDIDPEVVAVGFEEFGVEEARKDAEEKRREFGFDRCRREELASVGSGVWLPEKGSVDTRPPE